MATKKYTVIVADKKTGGVIFNKVIESRSSKILKSIYTEKYMFSKNKVKVSVKRKFTPPKYQINIFDVIENKVTER